jgi:hypothetical protein
MSCVGPNHASEGTCDPGVLLIDFINAPEVGPLVYCMGCAGRILVVATWLGYVARVQRAGLTHSDQELLETLGEPT